MEKNIFRTVRNFFFLQRATLFLGLLFVGLTNTDSFAQNQGTTNMGLNYTIFSGGNGTKLDSGMIALMYMRQVLVANGDTLMDQDPKQALPVQIMTPPEDPVMEGFLLLAEGDSAKFDCLAKVLLKDRMPPTLPDSTVTVFYLKVDRVFNSSIEYEAYMMELENNKKKEEFNQIEAYLKENNWEAQKTESGLYYIVEEEGTGEYPDQGDKISVHYTGRLLDGTKFDSSLDRDAPFQFRVGNGRVIQGWDEGFMLFKAGGKGKLIIPSYLAYGPRAMGRDIKPYSILVFDIEFIENLSKK